MFIKRYRVIEHKTAHIANKGKTTQVIRVVSGTPGGNRTCIPPLGGAYTIRCVTGACFTVLPGCRSFVADAYTDSELISAISLHRLFTYIGYFSLHAKMRQEKLMRCVVMRCGNAGDRGRSPLRGLLLCHKCGVYSNAILPAQSIYPHSTQHIQYPALRGCLVV